MARFIDSDSIPPPPPQVKGTDRIRFSYTIDGKPRYLDLLTMAYADCGRNSLKDLCLRIEPIDNNAKNYEMSKSISSNHFGFRYLGNSLMIIDLGSTNGTKLGNFQLAKNESMPIEGKTTINLADVLDMEVIPVERQVSVQDSYGVLEQASSYIGDPDWLNRNLLGDDKPGRWGYLRLRRINNKPEQEYVLLFHSAIISYCSESLLNLGLELPTPKGRRIDQLKDDTNPVILVSVRNRQIQIEKRGDIFVQLNGTELDLNEQVTLDTPGILMIGKTRIVLEKIIN